MGTEIDEGARMLEFAESIAGHGKSGHAVQAVFGTPRVGGKSCDLKFDWEAGTPGRGEACDVGVDAVGKCGEDGQCVGGVAFIFGLHVAAIAKRAGVHVAGTERRGRGFRRGVPGRSASRVPFERDDPERRRRPGRRTGRAGFGRRCGHSPAVAEDIDCWP